MVEITIHNQKGYCMIFEAFPSSNPLEETSAHTDKEPQEPSANCVAISSATVKSRNYNVSFCLPHVLLTCSWLHRDENL